MNTVTETVEVLKTKVVFSSSSETYQFRMQQINQGSEAGSVELRLQLQLSKGSEPGGGGLLLNDDIFYYNYHV